MNETKTKNVMATARQRFLTETPTKDTTRTASVKETVHTASKTAQSTKVNTPRARSTAKARFGTQTAHVMRVAGLKTVEMATVFIPTRTVTLTKENGTSTSDMGMAFIRIRQLGPSIQGHGYRGNGTGWESLFIPITDSLASLQMITFKDRVDIDLILAVNSTESSCWKSRSKKVIQRKRSPLLC